MTDSTLPDSISLAEYLNITQLHLPIHLYLIIQQRCCTFPKKRNYKNIPYERETPMHKLRYAVLHDAPHETMACTHKKLKHHKTMDIKSKKSIGKGPKSNTPI